jgi:hypothetical protein
MTQARTARETQDPLRAANDQLQALLRPYRRTSSGRVRSVLNDVNQQLGIPRRFAEPAWEQWRRVLKNSREELASLSAPKGPRVLLASAAMLWDEIKLVIESTLAAALRLRGADVHVMVCGSSLPACEITPWGNYTPDPGPAGPELRGLLRRDCCRSCTHQVDKLFAQLPVNRVRLSDAAMPHRIPACERTISSLNPNDYRGYQYKGINVGEYAYASMLRTTLRGTLEDDPTTALMFRRYMFSIVYYVDLLERFFDLHRPDRVVVCDGVYAMMGTLSQFAERRGVPAVAWGVPLRKQTLWFERGDSVHRKLLLEPASSWDGFEFSSAKEQTIDEYLCHKRLGGKDYLAYHDGSVEDAPAIRAELGIGEGQRIVSLFTNVLWDAQIFYQGTAYPGMLEWLEDTIRYFESRPQQILAIRIHPAESRGFTPTRQPIAAEIERRFSTLPANVRVITPDSRISSYTLAEMSDAALIYGARMGWEIAALGTPLIIAGEAFSRGKGFSFDASSRDEYLALLERSADLPRNSAAITRKAKKYGYHFLYRRMLDLPILSPSLTRPELKFSRLRELTPGSCPPQLDLICDAIIDGRTPFIYDALD